MIFLFQLFLIVAASLSILLLVVNFILTKYFLRKTPADSVTPDQPPVSILKPLKGVDDGLEDNLRSFCNLNYPQYEIVFCIEHERDPAVPVVRKIIQEYPDQLIKLITPCPRTCSNPKISNLKYAYRQAQFDLIVYNDSEIRVSSDYLNEIVKPLANPKVGAVTGIPVYVHARNWVSGLEALTLNANVFGILILPFLAGKLDAVIGASVALRREVIEACQLFTVAQNHMADDGIIGRTLHNNGYQIHLAKYVVPMIQHHERFQNFIQRNIRWSRCIRVMKTKSYFIMGPLMGSLYAFIYFLMNPFQPLALTLLLSILCLRAIQIIHHNIVYAKDPALLRYLWMVPVRDIFISPLLWFLGTFGRTVWWRGVKYRFQKDGSMIKLATE